MLVIYKNFARYKLSKLLEKLLNMKKYKNLDISPLINVIWSLL